MSASGIDRLADLFAEVGAACADEDVLQPALDRLSQRLGERVCIDDPNKFGICPTCGTAMQQPHEIAGPHNPGEPLCFLPAIPAVIAYRVWWHARRRTSRVYRRVRYLTGLVPTDDAALTEEPGR